MNYHNGLEIVSHWLVRIITMAKSGGEEIGKAIGAVILGIAAGALTAAIIDALTKPKCPVCRNTINKGTAVCPHCNTWLQWGS